MSFHRIDLLSGLREQLELNERVNENLPMDDIIILERDKTSGDFSRLMSSVGYPEFRDHLGSGNLILILADERYLNPPPLTMVCDIFHTWNIPAQDYIDMIASFFPPHRLSQSPKVLRPTTYIESATDLRFPTGAPNRGFPWERIPPTVCYQLYFVDDQRAPKSRPALTPLPCRARATVPLNDEPKIHKSAVLVQPRADRVIVTTTHRDIISVFQRPPSNSLPFRDLFSDPLEEWVSSSHSQWLENSYDERLPVSAAQFTLAQFGSVGWDLCLNWIETSVERLREALSPSEGHEDVKEQSQGWDELWECLARLQRRRGDILKFMMANITVISAMERNSSDRYSRRNTGHSNSKELSWTLMHFRNRLQRQIDRAAIIEKSIELEMNRVARRAQAEQVSTSQWISMNSLKISFISQTFFQATAVVILLFVPFIFSSTLFSSWFFGPDGLDVANEYWIFWAISAPLTVVVLILTFLSYSLRSGIHTRLFRQRDDPMVPEPSPTSTQVLPVQTRESNV